MSARLEIECRAATFREARDDAQRKTDALCADGWRWLKTSAKPSERVVIVTLERAE